ncbi:MAG: DUF123 domain-containing protein [Anaerolineae bacterium]|nr:DUF123 domain-containing protein [Anaerolineae bacterium]
MTWTRAGTCAWAVRARVGRHSQAGKPIHWHIDRLTGAGGRNGNLVARVPAEAGMQVGANARGAAGYQRAGTGVWIDCQCQAHLFALKGPE